MGVNRCEPMVHEPCEWIVPKGRHEFESDPYHPIRDVAVLLVLAITGFHPWLQHAVPLGLRPNDETTKKAANER